jgi:DNA-binding HxlR family transcriptional regulator
MGFAESGETVCPVAQTLAMVGERWTILILRELFMGSTRFDEFQMYTDMSPHLLSTRLKGLEADGIIKRKQYQDRPPRFEYKLTAKGLDFFPLIVSLKAFGDKWGKYKSRGRAALTMIHTKCQHSTEMHMTCSHCAEEYGARDTLSELSNAFAAERQERKEAFLTKQRSKAASAA